jgi:hypothetical protein
MTVEVLKITPEGWKKIEPEEPVGEVANYYKNDVWAKGLTTGLGQVLGTLLGIPYEGELVDKRARRYDVHAALKTLGRPQKMWFNPRALLLVIDDGTHQVGIAVSQLRIPFMGLNWPVVETLYQGLKAHLVEH